MYFLKPNNLVHGCAVLFSIYSCTSFCLVIPLFYPIDLFPTWQQPWAARQFINPLTGRRIEGAFSVPKTKYSIRVTRWCLFVKEFPLCSLFEKLLFHYVHIFLVTLPLPSYNHRLRRTLDGRIVREARSLFHCVYHKTLCFVCPCYAVFLSSQRCCFIFMLMSSKFSCIKDRCCNFRRAVLIVQ